MHGVRHTQAHVMKQGVNLTITAHFLLAKKPKNITVPCNKPQIFQTIIENPSTRGICYNPSLGYPLTFFLLLKDME